MFHKAVLLTCGASSSSYYCTEYISASKRNEPVSCKHCHKPHIWLANRRHCALYKFIYLHLHLLSQKCVTSMNKSEHFWTMSAITWCWFTQSLSQQRNEAVRPWTWVSIPDGGSLHLLAFARTILYCNVIYCNNTDWGNGVWENCLRFSRSGTLAVRQTQEQQERKPDTLLLHHHVKSDKQSI